MGLLGNAQGTLLDSSFEKNGGIIMRGEGRERNKSSTSPCSWCETNITAMLLDSQEINIKEIK